MYQGVTDLFSISASVMRDCKRMPEPCGRSTAGCAPNPGVGTIASKMHTHTVCYCPSRRVTQQWCDVRRVGSLLSRTYSQDITERIQRFHLQDPRSAYGEVSCAVYFYGGLRVCSLTKRKGGQDLALSLFPSVGAAGAASPALFLFAYLPRHVGSGSIFMVMVMCWC